MIVGNYKSATSKLTYFDDRMRSSVDITLIGDARLGGVLRAAGALPLVVKIVQAALPPRKHSSHASCVLGMRSARLRYRRYGLR